MRSSIKTKALFFLIAIPSVLMAALAVALFAVEYRKDLRNAEGLLAVQADTIRDAIHLEVSKGLEMLRTIATNPQTARVAARMAGSPLGLDNDDYRDIEEFGAVRETLDHAQRGTAVDLVYIASAGSSGLILGRDLQMAAGFDVRGRDYYKLAMESPGEFVMSEPRVSAEQSAVPVIVITAARALTGLSGETPGIAAFNYRLTPIIDMIKAQMDANAVEIALYDTVNARVLWDRSDERERFFDPAAPMPLSELVTGFGFSGDEAASVLSTLLDDEGHSFIATAGGVKYLARTLHIPDTRWGIAVRFPRDVIVSSLLASIVPPLILFFSIFLLAQLGLYFLVSSAVIKPLVAIGHNLKALAEADADLTVRLPQSTRDEIGQVAESFNRFAGKLAELMAGVKSAIERTNLIKQNVSASTEETSSAVEEISANLASVQRQIETLDATSDENAAAISRITDNIVRVDDQIQNQSAMVEQSTSAITQMMASLASVSSIAQTKRRSTAALTKIAEDSNDGIVKTADTFNSVVNQINQIKEMAAAINGISSQTNLLSMNAAIEAAHAGEAGKGFAVVAEEIRKLADSAARSSATIAKLIKDIQASVKLTDANMARTSGAFKNITAEVGSAVDAFTEIEQAVAELAVGGKQILDSIHEINAVTAGVKDGSSDIKASTTAMVGASARIKEVSDRVIAGMAEATMGSGEIVRSMQVLVGQSQELSGIVDELRDKFGRFKTE